MLSRYFYLMLTVALALVLITITVRLLRRTPLAGAANAADNLMGHAA